MEASGLFFLRMHATTGADATGQRSGVLLPVLERDPKDPRVILNQLLAKWKGPEALAFYDANRAELRAGRPLLLKLDRLRGGASGEWEATVLSCELAPVARSWHVHAERTANPNPNHA